MFKFEHTQKMKSVVGGIFGGGGGSDTSGAARDAANIQAQAQREALAYLKETNAIPQKYREQALKQLGALASSPEANTEFLEGVKSGGLYDALLSGQEEAALRAQSATGGLRSGQAISDVGSVQNKALLQSYNSQLGNLQSLAGLQTNENQIANMISGIGQTQAQGIVAAAQNQQASNQAGFGNLMGLGQLGLSAYSAFSDERLKDDIEPTGETNGIQTFRWKWNKEAEKLGLKGYGFGTLSKVVKQIMPEAVTEKGGYEQVNYKMIGVNHG